MALLGASSVWFSSARARGTRERGRCVGFFLVIQQDRLLPGATLTPHVRRVRLNPTAFARLFVRSGGRDDGRVSGALRPLATPTDASAPRAASALAAGSLRLRNAAAL